MSVFPSKLSLVSLVSSVKCLVTQKEHKEGYSVFQRITVHLRSTRVFTSLSAKGVILHISSDCLQPYSLGEAIFVCDFIK